MLITELTNAIGLSGIFARASLKPSDRPASQPVSGATALLTVINLMKKGMED